MITDHHFQVSSGKELPDYEFVLYIDEAGDPGLKSIAPIDPNGASEWMTLGGVLMRKKYEREVVSWVKGVRKDINATQGPSLHFRDLSNTKKIAACDYISKLPIRAFCIASNKRNMKNHRNYAAERNHSKDYFYNWCLRLLLERVSGLVMTNSQKEFGQPKLIKVVLAERGGHSYTHTISYIEKLQLQAKANTTLLNRRQIEHECLDGRLLFTPSAKISAGAQLADVVSSAFYTAVRSTDKLSQFTEPAMRLKPIVAQENGKHRDFGLTLQPMAHIATLTNEQKEIFKYYGYSF